MSEPQPALPIHFVSLLKWVLPPVLGMAAFGVLPTWLTCGWPGVAGQSVAVFIVLGVMLGCGGLTVYAARQGAGQASTVFLGSSLLRMVLCPTLVGLAWLVTQLPAKPMAVWMMITYLACLALECAWIVRALRRSARETETKPQENINE
jgi:hypothetical protein